MDDTTLRTSTVASVGVAVGAALGVAVGAALGATVGRAVGAAEVGAAVGATLGEREGASEGAGVGAGARHLAQTRHLEIAQSKFRHWKAWLLARVAQLWRSEADSAPHSGSLHRPQVFAQPAANSDWQRPLFFSASHETKLGLRA